MAEKVKEYIEMLTHPKWQRKRLEIMQRDNFTCVRCGDDETTLNVHHKEYHRNKKPWEYDAEFLETLCEPCHKKEHTKPKVEITSEEWAMIANHPSRFTDPEELKKILDESDKLRDELGAAEKDKADFDTVLAPILTKLVDLNKRKQALLKAPHGK